MCTLIFHIYSNLILFNDSKYVSHNSIDSLSKLQSKRLVTTSVSLGTQTGLCYLAIQVINTRVYFHKFWYTFLTSVYYNLEHGLAIVTESFSPLNLDYITSIVEVWARSGAISHTIPSTVYLPCALNWFELAWTGHRLLSRCWWSKLTLM